MSKRKTPILMVTISQIRNRHPCTEGYRDVYEYIIKKCGLKEDEKFPAETLLISNDLSDFEWVLASVCTEEFKYSVESLSASIMQIGTHLSIPKRITLGEFAARTTAQILGGEDRVKLIPMPKKGGKRVRRAKETT